MTLYETQPQPWEFGPPDPPVHDRRCPLNEDTELAGLTAMCPDCEKPVAPGATFCPSCDGERWDIGDDEFPPMLTGWAPVEAECKCRKERPE